MEYAARMTNNPITGRQLFEEAGLRSDWIMENHGSPITMWNECQSLAALTIVALRYAAPHALVLLALAECVDIISDDDTSCHSALTQEIHDWITDYGRDEDHDIAIDVSHNEPDKACCTAMSGLLTMVTHDDNTREFHDAMISTLTTLGEHPKLADVFRRIVPLSCFSVPYFGSLTNDNQSLTV